MATERLAAKLRGFGLEKEEAEIYVFISASGPTPARVVARRFNLNRMKAYRSLKALEEKEFVQRVMGRPVKFVAAPLEGRHRPPDGEPPPDNLRPRSEPRRLHSRSGRTSQAARSSARRSRGSASSRGGSRSSSYY